MKHLCTRAVNLTAAECREPGCPVHNSLPIQLRGAAGLAHEEDGRLMLAAAERIDDLEEKLVPALDAHQVVRQIKAGLELARQDPKSGNYARRVQAELLEQANVNRQLAEVLDAVAAALLGPPKKGMQHDWAALPGLVAELRE